MTLDKCLVGEYTITSLNGGVKFKERMCSLGLTLGRKIRVLHNKMYYPIIIKCCGATLSLGRGMASKIEVKK